MQQKQENNLNNISTQEEKSRPYKNTGRINKLIKEKNTKITELQKQIKQTDSVETKNELHTKIKRLKMEF